MFIKTRIIFLLLLTPFAYSMDIQSVTIEEDGVSQKLPYMGNSGGGQTSNDSSDYNPSPLIQRVNTASTAPIPDKNSGRNENLPIQNAQTLDDSKMNLPAPRSRHTPPAIPKTSQYRNSTQISGNNIKLSNINYSTSAGWKSTENIGDQFNQPNARKSGKRRNLSATADSLEPIVSQPVSKKRNLSATEEQLGSAAHSIANNRKSLPSTDDANRISLAEYSGRPNQSDHDNGVAAVKRVINMSADRLPGRGARIPNNLVELSETFNFLKQKVMEGNQPDIIDLLLLIDTNGKTQTAAAIKFLSNLENALIEHTLARSSVLFSELKIRLASIFDSVLGAGYGAIPAAVIALGDMTQEELLEPIWGMPSKMLSSNTTDSFLSCCGCVTTVAGSTVSAYYGETPEYVSNNSSENNYDAIPRSKLESSLVNLFGATTTDELKTSLELISLFKDESILASVIAAILARDDDTAAQIKRVFVSELLSNAQEALSAASGITSGENWEHSSKLEYASTALEQLSISLNQSPDKKYGSLSELRDSLMKNTDIPRDLIILNLVTDTFSGKIMIPSFSYDIKRARNGKNIVNLNYKLAIPAHFYTPKKREAEFVRDTIDSMINSLFPREKAKASNVSIATGLLINFLNTCNDRVLRAVEDTHIFYPIQIDDENAEEEDMQEEDGTNEEFCFVREKKRVLQVVPGNWKLVKVNKELSKTTGITGMRRSRTEVSFDLNGLDIEIPHFDIPLTPIENVQQNSIENNNSMTADKHLENYDQNLGNNRTKLSRRNKKTA